MKKSTIIATLLASTLIFGSTAVYAQGNNNANQKQGQKQGKHFNKDGQKGGGFGKRGGGRRGGRGGQIPQFIIDAADADKDGKISQDEMKAYKEAQFKKYDADGDGKLSQEEMTTMRDEHKAMMQDARFKALDTDGDGSISQEELSNGHKGGPRKGGNQGNN